MMDDQLLKSRKVNPKLVQINFLASGEILISLNIVALYQFLFFFSFFLVGYVEERPWWPIQSPYKGRKKKASS